MCEVYIRSLSLEAVDDRTGEDEHEAKKQKNSLFSVRRPGRYLLCQKDRQLEVILDWYHFGIRRIAAQKALLQGAQKIAFVAVSFNNNGNHIDPQPTIRSKKNSAAGKKSDLLIGQWLCVVPVQFACCPSLRQKLL